MSRAHECRCSECRAAAARVTRKWAAYSDEELQRVLRHWRTRVERATTSSVALVEATHMLCEVETEIEQRAADARPLRRNVVTTQRGSLGAVMFDGRSCDGCTNRMHEHDDIARVNIGGMWSYLCGDCRAALVEMLQNPTQQGSN